MDVMRPHRHTRETIQAVYVMVDRTKATASIDVNQLPAGSVKLSAFSLTFDRHLCHAGNEQMQCVRANRQCSTSGHDYLKWSG